MHGTTPGCWNFFTNEGAVTALATVVIAVFTIVLGLSAYFQLRHTRAIERAYVTGGGDYVRDLAGAVFLNSAGKRVFQVHVGNYGKTPLYLSHYDVHFAKLADLIPEKFARPVSQAHPFRDRLAPGGHSKPIGEHEIKDSMDDIVYGAFWYQDIWKGREHQFRFILSLGTTRTWTTVKGVHEDYFDWD